MALSVRTAPAHEFPTLDREGLVYLDSAATSQTPAPVIAAMTDYYERHRASIHRGVYPLAQEATDLYEGARERAAAWLRWPARDTVFTRNATEALNLVAYAWGRANLGPGDRVVLTEMEHHSNIVPWQLACQATGATLSYVGLDDDGRLRLEQLDALLAGGDVRIVGVVHVSNVVGTVNPVAEIARRAHAAGALVVVDGTQAVPQLPVDLSDVDADFYAWTGHKAYGPTGVGILHGRRELLAAMPPWLGGGHMIQNVAFDQITFAAPPARFEAGTSAIAEGIGLGAAVELLEGLGMETVRAHERDLVAYATERLGEIDGLDIHGPGDPDRRGALLSFAMDGIHPHDVADILGRDGVCVRAGHHCAQPLMKRLGITASTRASFAVHNTREDVDRLVAGLHRVGEIFA
jgi:cysteine desulfurase / selenocysteine lyase